MPARGIVKDAFTIEGKYRYGRLLVLLLCTFGLLGLGLEAYVRKPEITDSIRGKELAQRMGCFACHGPEGFRGVPDPVSPGGRMPGWDEGMAPLYVDTEEEIEEWILNGHLTSEEGRQEELGAENLAPMPAYRDLIGEKELEDLKAYFIAVAEYYPSMPDEAYEGSLVAKRFGCFGCHGPSGMGGIQNPGSFTGIVPSWKGEHFAELVENDSELQEWILDGKVQRIMDHPIGRYFMERQIIQMPAYRNELSEADLQKLLAYIKWLRGAEAKDREADNPIA
ncbi:c-type cytochrome [Pelagicoccus sp. SDUM812002]|uniref:c-type cytochrome n=1 Tax=Pelagicoccus sp. SDUM812002 TaxID=3041266 RepID=UPI00280F8F15|nr:c-type cytochrome [Pelagicoccus sp. SDUM812002]MDQ8186635.1 c-type cytochrome [Pelagicoccus sp. SDUM812002]